MESKTVANSEVTNNTSAPAQGIDKDEVVIKVGDLPTEVEDTLEADSNTEEPSGNEQFKKLEAILQGKVAPAAVKRPKKTAGKKRHMFVMISRHTGKLTLAHASTTLRLYSAFMQFFIIMNLSLLLLLVYLTRKSAVVRILNRTAASVSSMLQDDLTFPMGLFMATLVAQLYFFLTIIYQIRRRR